MIKKVVQSYIILTIIIGNLYIFSFVNAAPGDTTRVSVASDGTQGNGNIGIQSISGDGRYVAFSSDASNLVPGDTNEESDIFLHDRQTGETIRVSVASDGTQGNNYSGSSSISANGRYVAFLLVLVTSFQVIQMKKPMFSFMRFRGRNRSLHPGF